MKRFHLSLTVADLDESVAFYAQLFGRPPSMQKDDYAKWMLDDPLINFSLSTHGDRPGIDHVGLQFQSDEELDALRATIAAAEAPHLDQTGVTCCYATSNKAWVRDPNGVVWEGFVSHGESQVYGDGSETVAARHTSAGKCCAPDEGSHVA